MKNVISHVYNPKFYPFDLFANIIAQTNILLLFFFCSSVAKLKQMVHICMWNTTWQSKHVIDSYNTILSNIITMILFIVQITTFANTSTAHIIAYKIICISSSTLGLINIVQEFIQCSICGCHLSIVYFKQNYATIMRFYRI